MEWENLRMQCVFNCIGVAIQDFQNPDEVSPHRIIILLRSELSIEATRIEATRVASLLCCNHLSIKI